LQHQTLQCVVDKPLLYARWSTSPYHFEAEGLQNGTSSFVYEDVIKCLKALDDK